MHWLFTIRMQEKTTFLLIKTLCNGHHHLANSLYIGILLQEAREVYERLFDQEESPVLYASPWWLDATCGRDGWDAYVSMDHESKPVFVIPYCKTKIKGMNACINPPMTQWLPVLRSNSPEKISIPDFINSLRSYSILDLSFRPEANILYPGHVLTVHFKYSYIIPSSVPRESIKLNYNDSLKRNLKISEQQYTIKESDDIKTFLKLCESTFQLRNMPSPPWLRTIATDVYHALKKHHKGKLEFAMREGEPIAGILTGWDQKTSYYLLAGRTGDDRGASAHSILLNNSIMEANDARRSFDFEGSMHSGIAHFFHSFGAAPVAYWQIRQYKGAGKLWSLFHKY